MKLITNILDIFSKYLPQQYHKFSLEKKEHLIIIPFRRHVVPLFIHLFIIFPLITMEIYLYVY